MIPAFIPPAIGALGANFARIGITSATMKANLIPNFVQSLPYGAGYSLGTYLGFPKNYSNNTNKQAKTYYLRMPYYYSRYPRRYRRYRRRTYRSYRRYY